MINWFAKRRPVKVTPELTAEESLELKKKEARRVLRLCSICPHHGLPLEIKEGVNYIMDQQYGCSECHREKAVLHEAYLVKVEIEKRAALELLGLDQQYLAYEIRESLRAAK